MRISKTEQEIMEFFWERQENQTFAGMLAYGTRREEELFKTDTKYVS